MITRLERKHRTEEDDYSEFNIFDLIDGAVKEVFRLNDEELDYLCDHATDEEIGFIMLDPDSLKEKDKKYTISDAKNALKTIQKHLTKLYNE